MKYLLSYLEGVDNAPAFSDPGFQQLLLDVQAGKTPAKSADAWYESLEKVVTELKSSPESVVFHRPVSKRDAPDYHNCKSSSPFERAYALADFATDLDLIWENCLAYNTQETHPIRVSARLMQQKANHHLRYLADRTDRNANSLLPLLAVGIAPSPAPSHALSAQATIPASTRADSMRPQDDEDAAGESDDGETQMQEGRGAKTLLGTNGLVTPDATADGRSMSVTSVPGMRIIGKADGDIKTRRRAGGEVGELQATLSVKRATAGLLAHAGFEGANETALDTFTRVAVNHLRNLGQTMRLLIDSFSNDMDAEDIVLHTLHETGHVQTADLEAHIKDDIERDSAKIADIERKVRTAYKDMLAGPVIQDDMIFSADGQMLQHGDFAEDLGEDFLGLRELGLDKEFGLSSLSVPKSLFFGRRGRGPGVQADAKEDTFDFTPPPPFIPLSTQTLSHLPALLHAFFAQRMETGLGLQDDVAFEPSQAQIGPLGQIVVKKEAKKTSKKDESEKKPKPVKKPVVPGVGKGNWIRPPKEERDRRAAEKKKALEMRRAEADEREEEDAEGEDE
ncbi:Transcriptional activator spt7 [Cryptotrichosporon argae]